MTQIKKKPKKIPQSLVDKMQRRAYADNGRPLVKTTLIEVQCNATLNKYKIPDQPAIREYHVWYVDFIGGDYFPTSPKGFPVPTITDLIVASVVLNLQDYDGVVFMDRYPAASLVQLEQSIIYGTSGLVGQCVNWTQSTIECFAPGGLPGTPFSFLLEVGYSFNIDWRLDPVTSYANKI